MIWKTIAFVTAISIACIGLAVIVAGKKITLVAEEEVAVESAPYANVANVNRVATLKPGEEVQVSSCIDVKHYIVPEVVLNDGSKGYVVVGRFHLIRRHVLQSPSGPIVMSCP